jgi:glycosidase
MPKVFSEQLFDWYVTRLDLTDSRLMYVFTVTVDGEKYFFSEDGITQTFDFNLAYFNAFQLPYINACDLQKPVEWLSKAVVYEIFVDRFFMANTEGKDYINMEWGEKPTAKSYAGGDLNGITEKLPYIQQLGADTVYLTPIFSSPTTNHKYKIIDYYNVDSHFGTNNDFKRLVETAHKMGMRVVLDAVFNHCGAGFPPFQDVLKNREKSPYFDWFIPINPDKGEYEHFGYELFDMPKLNTSNSAVRKYFLDVAAHWQETYGIDGWRLDVSDEISHKFWREFRERVKGINPEAVIIGENWHDANPYLRGDEYDSIMNYAFTRACVDFFAEKTISAQTFSDRLNSLLMRNTTMVNDMMLNLLDSHDTDRFLTLAMTDKTALRAALACLFVFPGAAMVYYGTETDMEGGYDPDCRRTFDWTKAEPFGETAKLIQKLSALRKSGIMDNKDISIYADKDKLFIKRGKVTFSTDGRAFDILEG